MRTTHLAILALSFAQAACSAAVAKDDSPSENLTPPKAVVAPPNGWTNAGGFKHGSSVPGDCAVYEERLYLLAASAADRQPATLFRYDPQTLSKLNVGLLTTCPKVDRAAGTGPISMTLDADGQTWVLFSEDSGKRARLWEVDTESHECWDTSVVLTGVSGKQVSAAIGGVPQPYAGDPLLLGISGVFGSNAKPQFATLDLNTSVVKTLATLDTFVPLGLAATDDNRFIGFAGTEWAQIDPKTGKLVAKPSALGIPDDTRTVFGSWGGDLWMFQPVTGEATPRSRVFTTSSESGETTLEADIDMWIVGAGSFSCGPPTVE